jgi:anti-anti-sigma factor
MQIKVDQLDKAAVLEVSGEIDMVTAPQLQQAIDEAWRADAGAPAVVVDLSEVTFLASAGLAVLAASTRGAPEAARLLVVAHGPATARPIQLTGLTEFLDLYPTAAEALAAL